MTHDNGGPAFPVWAGLVIALALILMHMWWVSGVSTVMDRPTPAAPQPSGPAVKPGAGVLPLTSRPSAPAIRMRVTAYCPCSLCCGPSACGITASGQPVTANGGRFCAADRRYPFGTMMDIPGYGRVPVLDRGGAIRGDRIDVYFPLHKDALAFGVKWLDVEIGD